MDENGNLGVFIPSNLITMNNDMIRACYNVVTNEMRLLLVAMAKTPKIITPKDNYKVSIRPTPIAFSKHEAGAHQYPYLYG